MSERTRSEATRDARLERNNDRAAHVASTRADVEGDDVVVAGLRGPLLGRALRRGLARGLLLGGPPALLLLLLGAPVGAGALLLGGLCALPATVVEVAGARRVRAGAARAGSVALVAALVIGPCAALFAGNLIYASLALERGPTKALDALTALIGGATAPDLLLATVAAGLFTLPFVIAAAPGPRGAEGIFEWGGLAVGPDGVEAQSRFMRTAALEAGLGSLLVVLLLLWTRAPADWTLLLTAPAAVVLLTACALTYAAVVGGFIALVYEVADSVEAALARRLGR